jgi:aminopeptidase N
MESGCEWRRDAREAAAAGRTRIHFVETQPLPTYLFAFVTGKFQVETAGPQRARAADVPSRDRRAKVARNREAIFDLHATALDWLETYTAIPYAFGKFDVVLIPSFQFSGMEHAGAILYNASSLLLDESATQTQKLDRASVIAHETSHMWFGDLVTMRWFNDVWMKEVFANFMAAKIVNPSFPELNHELRFLMTHYPARIRSIARRAPIRSPDAGDLNEAGSSMGRSFIRRRRSSCAAGADAGERPFRDGLRVYLKRYAYGMRAGLDLVRSWTQYPERSRRVEPCLGGGAWTSALRHEPAARYARSASGP